MEVLKQRLNTRSIRTMLLYPNTVVTLLSALDFGLDHAYGTQNIIMLIIIIIRWSHPQWYNSSSRQMAVSREWSFSPIYSTSN